MKAPSLNLGRVAASSGDSDEAEMGAALDYFQHLASDSSSCD